MKRRDFLFTTMSFPFCLATGNDRVSANWYPRRHWPTVEFESGSELLEIRLGRDVVRAIGPSLSDIVSAVQKLRVQLKTERHINLPAVRLRSDNSIDDGEIRLLVCEQSVLGFSVATTMRSTDIREVIMNLIEEVSLNYFDVGKSLMTQRTLGLVNTGCPVNKEMMQ